MAQSMGNAARVTKVRPTVFWPVPPTNIGANNVKGEFEYADATAAPTLAALGNGDFGQPCHWFRCIFNIKAFVLPTGTSPLGSAIYIECGDNAALTTNNRKLNITRLGAIAADGPPVPVGGALYWTFDLQGCTADGARQFARPGVTLGTGGTTNATIAFDAFLSAAYPGAGGINDL